MNIGDVTKGNLSSPKHLKQQQVDPASGVDAYATQRQEGNDKRQRSQDSIAISEEARRALEADRKQLKDLEDARAAYDAIPSLSEERIREIQERLSSGFYTQPGVIDEIAAKIADALEK